MKVLVTRAPAKRMTDMYTIRFPGHENRILPFRCLEFEDNFGLKLNRGEKCEVELKIEEIK